MASSSRTGPRQMARINNATKGDKINLLTNHFKVNFTKVESQDFFQYSVAITYEDKNPVESKDKTPVKGKGICRKILAKVKETYQAELGSKNFAYDGEKTLFTVGPLPQEELDFCVVLEDMSCSKSKTKTFNVEIRYAAKISNQAIKSIRQGEEPNDLQDAVRAMDVILRQNAASRRCLLVGQSFFEAKYLVPKPFEGLHPCRGFHSSFRPTQSGLSLNIDVSTTLLVRDVPVIDFLVDNQRVKGSSSINWEKAERTLKNLRVKLYPSNRECKISGLSKLSCREEKFIRKQKQENGDDKEVQVTVETYFTRDLNINKHISGHMRCINVGKLTRPTYIPIELCQLVPLQRYTKALTSSQRSKMVTDSVQSPRDKMDMLNKATKYNDDLMLKECGVSIGSNFTRVEGRVLPTPNLTAGNRRDIYPRNGRWNFNDKTFAKPVQVTKWAVVNFSSQCDTASLIRELIKTGSMKGMTVDPPYPVVFQEDPQFTNDPANIRVEKMFEKMDSELKDLGKAKFILCILTEKKNSLVYGPWKRKTLIEEGIVTQCIAPQKSINNQYLTNVLLKINAKLGGLNSLLAMEQPQAMMPSETPVPTFIIGMDVSHGSPGSHVPSIAAVVGSREWPLISKYRACVRTQPRGTEMIENLFKRVTYADGTEADAGIFWELLCEFHKSSDNRKPEHIIIFRDGVSESQFTQVLSIELAQIREACKFRDENWHPKFTVIISVKRHHTRFFKDGANVSPGTIVDSGICSPYRNNFFLCAHAGKLGTSRPIHYHVLLNEIGFTTDELQELVHSLSYAYQRSTSAISQVAPVMYAHLAAAQMATAMSFDDNSETSSSHGGATTSEAVHVPPMPKLHKNVASSMFFC